MNWNGWEMKRIYPECSFVRKPGMVAQMINLYPDTSGYIKRIGYRGFFSMIWTLWKMNRGAKKANIKCKAEITFPLRWIR